MTFLKDCTNRIQIIRSQLLERPLGKSSCVEEQLKRPQVQSVATKLCYAVGGVPLQVTTVSLGISMQIFLLEVLQMEPFYVSMILFVSRAWDAVTDPLVGYLVSRSNWTPIGKFTPWLVVSTPLCVLSYLLLWFVPPGFVSSWSCVLWVLIASCLFETLMSCYNVPYFSLNMFLGGDQRDRDSATAYRMSVEMGAMLLASVVHGHIVSEYNTEKDTACEELDRVYETPPSTSSSQTAVLPQTQKAFMTSALAMGALFFLCSLVVFLGVKEQQGPLCACDKNRTSYLTSLKMLIRHVPYQRLVLGFVFTAFAFQMSLGNFALFCSHAAGLGAHFQHLLLVLLVSAILAVPLWQSVLLRIGKKATAFIGLSLFIPAVIVVACVPTNLSVFMMMCILMGCSMATIFLLPWSMLPDVVDDFLRKHPSCQDLEPLFFSLYAFFNKMAGGLSAGLSTMTLQFVGYNATACNQGDDVATALIVMFSPVPIALLLMGMLFIHSYSINERQSLTPHEELLPEIFSSSPSRKMVQQPSGEVTPTAPSKSKLKRTSRTDSSPQGLSLNRNASVKFPISLSTSGNHYEKNNSRKQDVRLDMKPVWHKPASSSQLRSGDARLGDKYPATKSQSSVSWV